VIDRRQALRWHAGRRAYLRRSVFVGLVGTPFDYIRSIRYRSKPIICSIGDTQDFGKIYDRYFDQIKQENSLLIARLNWFVTLSSILFACYTFMFLDTYQRISISSLVEERYGINIDNSFVMGDFVLKITLMKVLAAAGFFLSTASFISIFSAFIAMSRIRGQYRIALQYYRGTVGKRINRRIKFIHRAIFGRSIKYVEVVEYPQILGGGSKAVTYLGQFFPLQAPLMACVVWSGLVLLPSSWFADATVLLSIGVIALILSTFCVFVCFFYTNNIREATYDKRALEPMPPARRLFESADAS
jgi:hypothetical protein